MSLSYGFALRPADDSAAFADALHAVTGDGITQQGGRFALTINGFTATLSSGYALAAGRWLQNDEPLPLTIGPSGNTKDRTDALVVLVDYEARNASLSVLPDVDPEEIRASPALLREDGRYCLLLYFIRVRRGVTSLSLEDVTDLRGEERLCGYTAPLSEIAGKVLYLYDFLTSGIDREVARLLAMSEQVVQKGDAAIVALDAAIQQAGGGPKIGDLMTARRHPEPAAEWLLCDGSRVPEAYPALDAMLGGTLPNLSQAEDRYRSYLYGGTPVG